MNITFFIGNGFDLNLGLNTGYQDFLQYFISEKPDNIIAKEISKDIELWADLETQLGKYAGDISGNDKVEFVDAKDTLEALLALYLQNICKRNLQIDATGTEEFRNNVVQFANMLTAAEQGHMREVVANTKEPINYHFITFNYTDFLDRIYAVAKNLKPFGQHGAAGTGYHDVLHPPLHIHGTLDGEMLLGVNDESQVGREGSNPDPEIVRYMIKPVVNASLGNQKIAQAQAIIDKSRYICVYGMSLGYTDKDWWVYIVDWLLKSKDNRLVLFMHVKGGRVISGSREARLQDEIRRRFLRIAEKEADFDKLSSQIIIRFNSPIFTFKNIKVEAEENG